MHGNVYMLSHVRKCDFVFNFEILYIYVYFAYMWRQMSYHWFGLPSGNKVDIIIIVIITLTL